MHKAEKTLLLLSLVALMLKIFNVVLSDLIWLLSLTLLATLYYIFGAALFNRIPLRKILKKERYANISRRRIVASVAFGWTMAILCIGIMFKLLFLPGSMFMLFLGFTLGLAGTLISSFFYHESKKEFFKGIWIRLIPAVLVTYALVNIPPLSLAETLEPEDIELHEKIKAQAQK